MIAHVSLNNAQVFQLIRQNKNLLAGNARLKIYGRRNCTSGKRIKKENRVFFKNETEAKLLGFRPCGHCMRELYNDWKKSSTS